MRIPIMTSLDLIMIKIALHKPAAAVRNWKMIFSA
jgi:hypothetical protein